MTCGYNWNLLNVREGKYRWKLRKQRASFSSLGAFKTYTLTYGKGRAR
jgi:hypothetical protein